MKKGLDQVTLELGLVFNDELLVLKKYVATELKGRAEEARILPATACSTGLVLYELSKKPDYFYSECIMLARSFIEKITNYCYVQVCSEEEYQKFLLHPYYRLFHNTDLEKYAGKEKVSLKYSGRENLRKNTQVSKALDLFSEDNPRLSWSSLNVHQKIGVLDEKSEIKTSFFLLNTLSLYSDASEALHGSLFGCALPTKAFRLVDSDVKKDNLKNICLIYAQLGSIANELIKQNCTSEDLLNISNENQEKAVVLMKEMLET